MPVRGRGLPDNDGMNAAAGRTVTLVCSFDVDELETTYLNSFIRYDGVTYFLESGYAVDDPEKSKVGRPSTRGFVKKYI